MPTSGSGVDTVEDYSAFSSQGLLITLTNTQWGGGSQTDGATACWGRFSVLVGQQNVTSDLYTRMYATLLTAKATGSQVALWVDTTTGPECRVQIVSWGRTAI